MGRQMNQIFVPSEFRERLVRELGGTKTLCVLMQNPSMAEAEDDTKNDPTILRLCGFTTRLGFGRLLVGNTYPRRTPQPKALYEWLYNMPYQQRDVYRQQALDIAVGLAREADMVIAAWGNGHADDNWPKRFAQGINAAGFDLHAFALTKDGNPRHPLARGKERIPDETVPFLWKAKAL